MISNNSVAMLSALQTIAEQTRKAKEARLESAAKPCPFCNKHLSKYICPRCKSGYCSLECYRSKEHTECLEGFHREQVVGRDDEEKKKMEEVLKKYEFMAPEDGGALKFAGDPDDIPIPEMD